MAKASQTWIHQIYIITILHVHFDSMQRQTSSLTSICSMHLYYSWTTLWCIIHTKLIVRVLPWATMQSHRINFIIYTCMIIVKDLVKYQTLLLCSIILLSKKKRKRCKVSSDFSLWQWNSLSFREESSRVLMSPELWRIAHTLLFTKANKSVPFIDSLKTLAQVTSGILGNFWV